jgi:hypothetical protein
MDRYKTSKFKKKDGRNSKLSLEDVLKVSLYVMSPAVKHLVYVA